MKEFRLLSIYAVVSIAVVMYLFSPSQAQTNLSLTGRVVYRSSNTPASSAWVEVIKNGRRIARSLTGDNGRYYISGLVEGTYEIVVVKSNQELFRHQLQLTDNHQTFNITLQGK